MKKKKKTKQYNNWTQIISAENSAKLIAESDKQNKIKIEKSRKRILAKIKSLDKVLIRRTHNKRPYLFCVKSRVSHIYVNLAVGKCPWYSIAHGSEK